MPCVPQGDSCNGMRAAGLDELVDLGGTACGPSLHSQAALQGLQAGALAAAIAARDEVHMGPADHDHVCSTNNDDDDDDDDDF